jgi:uncharacterized protein (DUF1697 family)
MTKYVALLRGIGPLNPNMRNEKLRSVFENLGFANVKTVISSGNVIFESDNSDAAAIEQQLETAWPIQLGFRSSTIVRTSEQLHDIIAADFFKGYQHDKKTYLTVTFLKHKKPITKWIGRGYKIIAADSYTIYAVVDLSAAKTPDLMLRLEKLVGKEITTRTWKTVERLYKAVS